VKRPSISGKPSVNAAATGADPMEEPAAAVIPRAAASACIFRGDTVLLVQRGKAPNQGRWSLPGGSIESGERAIDAATREVAEETGVVAALTGVVDVNDVICRNEAGTLTHHYVVMVFVGLGTGDPVAASDAIAAAFVPLQDVDGLAVGRRVHAIIMTAWETQRLHTG